MLFTNQEIECPGCGQKQMKQVRIYEIQDKWATGGSYRCETVGGHDETKGCGKLFMVSTRTKLSIKVNMVPGE